MKHESGVICVISLVGCICVLLTIILKYLSWPVDLQVKILKTLDCQFLEPLVIVA